jgi:hypothetical protein
MVKWMAPSQPNPLPAVAYTLCVRQHLRRNSSLDVRFRFRSQSRPESRDRGLDA